MLSIMLSVSLVASLMIGTPRWSRDRSGQKDWSLAIAVIAVGPHNICVTWLISRGRNRLSRLERRITGLRGRRWGKGS